MEEERGLLAFSQSDEVNCDFRSRANGFRCRCARKVIAAWYGDVDAYGSIMRLLAESSTHACMTRRRRRIRMRLGRMGISRWGRSAHARVRSTRTCAFCDLFRQGMIANSLGRRSMKGTQNDKCPLAQQQRRYRECDARALQPSFCLVHHSLCHIFLVQYYNVSSSSSHVISSSPRQLIAASPHHFVVSSTRHVTPGEW